MIGHRGAPGYRPEHSRASYELAIALGADAVEPDVVVSKDGVLVVRHENELASTTDIADRPEFAHLRTTKSFAGHEVTGWFAEDLTWHQLATLRCRERLPALRPASAAFDDEQPVLRLRDVLDLVRSEAETQGRSVGVVVELKHPSYFAHLGFDLAALLANELRDAGWDAGDATGLPLVIESFESTVLAQIRERGVRATYVYLLEGSGSPLDLVLRDGDAAPTYAQQATPEGLDALVPEVDGVSIPKRMILAPDRLGRTRGPSRVAADARERGLLVYTWTCRPENQFLLPQFRRLGGAGAFGAYEREWAVIRDAGVDGVFVDHPDLGAAFFQG